MHLDICNLMLKLLSSLLTAPNLMESLQDEIKENLNFPKCDYFISESQSILDLML